VISADLPVVGRRRPGQALRFAAIEVAEAEALALAEMRRLEGLVTSLAPVPDRSGLDLARLYAGNLISGVVSGLE